MRGTLSVRTVRARRAGRVTSATQPVPALVVALALAFSACAGCGPASEPDSSQEPPSPRRPNIVLILADDMGFSDIQPYGSEIRTPHLQRIADEGLTLTSFYNQARCMPARGSLLTGLYPTQSGIGHVDSDAGIPGYTGDLAEHAVTIAEVLRDAGYGTYMTGKWHVTTHTGAWGRFPERQSKHNWPLQRGFDRFYGMILGASSFYDPVTLTEDNDPLPSPGADYYFTDAVADRAAQYVRDHVADSPDAPFFLYASFTAPHWPLQAPTEDVEHYEGVYDRGWEALHAERVARLRELGLIDDVDQVPPPDERVRAWADLTDEERRWYARAMEVYAAQVELLDQGIGRLLDMLEETGVDDDTLLVFLSDNGACAEVLTNGWNGIYITRETHDGRVVTVGNENIDVLPGPEDTYMSYGREWAWASNAPFRLYKHFVHEGGIATPFLMRWPAATEGGLVVRDPGQLVDLMATFVDVAGATYPEQRDGVPVLPMEGVSLAPVLGGESLPERPLFFEHEGNRAVRQGRWKLVERFNGEGWELYDLQSDRAESSDLAAAQPERVAELRQRYDDWAARVGVLPWPLGRP